MIQNGTGSKRHLKMLIIMRMKDDITILFVLIKILQYCSFSSRYYNIEDDKNKNNGNNNFKNLAREIRLLWKVKIYVMPIVLEAVGTIQKGSNG